MNIMERNMTNISIWGPSGSGKTSLLYSFSRRLNSINRDDPDFSFDLFELINEDYRPTSIDLPPKFPTSNPEDYILTFRRVPKQRTKKHLVSAHSHNLLIHDYMGAAMLGSKDDISRGNIFFSDCLIIIIDPTLKSGVEIYNHYLPRLFSSNHFQESPIKHVAFCITKCDQLHYRGEPGWIYERIFGKTSISLLEKSVSRINYKFFLVSSYGFCSVNNRDIPNFDPSTGYLLYPEQWEPYQVEGPFFWLFQNIELEKINKRANLFFNDKNFYIPYPPPGS